MSASATDHAGHAPQQLLYDSVRRVLADLPRPRAGTHAADQVWSEVVALGLTGMTVADAYGGSGGGLDEIAAVQEAWGHGLARAPLVSTAVVGAWLIGHLGSAAQRAAWLPAIAAGSCRIALAELEPGDRHVCSAPRLRATSIPGGYRLTGRKMHVPDGDRADLVLVSAQLDEGPTGSTLFAIPAQAAGLTCRAFPTLDGATAAQLDLQDVVVDATARLGAPGTAGPWLAAARDRGMFALCWEAVGIMQALLAQTAEYLKQRQQFGQPLADFQALQHQVADMALDAGAARAAARMAQRALAACPAHAVSGEHVDRASAPDALTDVAAAKIFVGEAGRRVGEVAVQLHGGMGMTDELAIGHHFKRLHVIDLTWGDAAFHLQAQAATLIGAADGVHADA